MTNAEATKVIQTMLAVTDLSVRGNLTADMVKACRMAIKALSEPIIPLSVIEKIKANIDKLPDLNPDYPMDMTTHVSKWAVFEIIDEAVKEIEHEL